MEIVGGDEERRPGCPIGIICRAMRIPLVDLGSVAGPEEGESSLPQSPGTEEGGAVRSCHFGGGDPVAWTMARSEVKERQSCTDGIRTASRVEIFPGWLGR